MGMKTALVTGSSRGLGLEFVRQLVQRNIKVYASCRNISHCEELQSLSHSQDYRNMIQVIELDVSDSKSIERAAEEVSKDTDSLDILINNAGIASKNHPVDPCALACPEDMLRLYRTNVIGPLLVSRSFMPLLKKSTDPLVLSISSCRGSISLNSEGGVVGYRTSKAALNQLIVTMSVEYPGIRFLAINPGWVRTDMGNARGRHADLDACTSIKMMLETALDCKPSKPTGSFLALDGKVLPW